MKTGWRYAARVGVAWAILLVGVTLAVARESFFLGDHLISVVAQLDIFHHLFYAWIAAGALALAIGGRTPASIGAAVAIAALGLLPLAAVFAARPTLVWALSWQIFFGPALLTANLLAASRPGAPQTGATPWLARAARAVPVVDLLAPLVVWRAYRAWTGRRAVAGQLAAIAMLAVVGNLPFFMMPLTYAGQPNIDPAIAPLGAQTGYQVAVDPDDGNVVVSAGENGLVKIDATGGGILAKASFGDAAATMQGFAVDAPRRTIAYADPCTGDRFLVRMADLSFTRDPAGIAPGDRPDWCGAAGKAGVRAACQPADGLMVEYVFQAGFLLFPPDGPMRRFVPDDAATADLVGSYFADGACDAARHRVYLTNIGRWSFSFDIREQRVLARRRLTSFPERLAVDAATDRVFVTQPITSEVVVSAGEKLRPVATFSTLPAVRTITVSPETGRLYLGSFAPYIEIRSLADYSLIDRIVSPPWSRWIAVDARRDRAYFSALVGTLWRLDTAGLGGDDWRHQWRRIDPFFPIAAATTRLLHGTLRRLTPNKQIYG